MGEQNSAAQTAEAEIDRKIVELSHAISLNPKSGKAYRDRALLYMQKRKFQSALTDLNEAVAVIAHDEADGLLSALPGN